MLAKMSASDAGSSSRNIEPSSRATGLSATHLSKTAMATDMPQTCSELGHLYGAEGVCIFCRAPKEELQHTCHDMNPPFPGPCAACDIEAASGSPQPEEQKK